MVTRTDLDQLTIVKLLASGRDPQFVGDAVNVSRDVVIDIASRHGHPDKKKLQWAADIMQANIDKQRTSELPAATVHRPAARANGTTLAAVPNAPRPAQPPAPTTQPTQTGTDRARAEKEKRQKDAAMAEIVALEAQLAAARAKLGIGKKKAAGKKASGYEVFERPGRGRAPAQLEALSQRMEHQDEVLTRHGASRADLITWAQANGWPDASQRGRFIKTEILDAYDSYTRGH